MNTPTPPQKNIHYPVKKSTPLRYLNDYILRYNISCYEIHQAHNYATYIHCPHPFCKQFLVFFVNLVAEFSATWKLSRGNYMGVKTTYI